MSPAATLDDDHGAQRPCSARPTPSSTRAASRASGMADIRDDSGVSLRRLYALYPSKRDLVAAWLTARHTSWMEWFAGAVERLAAPAGEPLLAAFDARRRVGRLARLPRLRLRQHGGRERPRSTTPTGGSSPTTRRVSLTYLTSLAHEGGYAHPERLGRMIAVLLDGAMVEAAVLSSREPIDAARDAAAVLLEASPMSLFVQQLWRYPGEDARRRAPARRPS